MRSKLALTVVSAIALLAGFPAAFGQGVYVSPVPNIPFMAIVTVQRNQVFPDGTTRSLKTIHAIARDSQGEIFNDRRTWIPSASNDTPSIVSIHIYDPQNRVSTSLLPRQQIAIQRTLLRPPLTEPLSMRLRPQIALPSANWSKRKNSVPERWRECRRTA